jgi:hypothetical protein
MSDFKRAEWPTKSLSESTLARSPGDSFFSIGVALIPFVARTGVVKGSRKGNPTTTSFMMEPGPLSVCAAQIIRSGHRNMWKLNNLSIRHFTFAMIGRSKSMLLFSRSHSCFHIYPESLTHLPATNPFVSAEYEIGGAG